MKKLSLIIFLGLLSACETSEVSEKCIDYSFVTENLNTVHKGVLDAALSGDHQNVYTSAYGFMKEHYFSGAFELDVESIKNSPSGRSNGNVDLSFLTIDQQNILQPFLQKIVSLDDVTEISGDVEDFNALVISSSLNNEQKYQLLAIASSVKISAEFIQDALIKQRSLSGRTQAIDVKGALQAGVIGLGIGAVKGGYVGCTGGTVAFPGLGTATGCVGGAVIGGAVGFIGGVATSILQDLLF